MNGECHGGEAEGSVLDAERERHKRQAIETAGRQLLGEGWPVLEQYIEAEVRRLLAKYGEANR
jgi:mannitol/fructose-specific phosphotransferase system IIA component